MDSPILTLLSKMFAQLSRQGAMRTALRQHPAEFRLLLPAPVLALLEQEVSRGLGQGAALPYPLYVWYDEGWHVNGVRVTEAPDMNCLLYYFEASLHPGGRYLVKVPLQPGYSNADGLPSEVVFSIQLAFPGCFSKMPSLN